MEGQLTQSTSERAEDDLNRKEEEEIRRNLVVTVLDTAARERCTSFISLIVAMH